MYPIRGLGQEPEPRPRARGLGSGARRRGPGPRPKIGYSHFGRDISVRVVVSDYPSRDPERRNGLGPGASGPGPKAGAKGPSPGPPGPGPWVWGPAPGTGAPAPNRIQPLRPRYLGQSGCTRFPLPGSGALERLTEEPEVVAKLPKPYLALDPDMMTENYERCKQLLVLPTDKALLEMAPARSVFRPLRQPPPTIHHRARGR